jgi:hypothetical protein
MERGAFCEREKPPLHRRGGWGDRRSGEVLKVNFSKKEITVPFIVLKLLKKLVFLKLSIADSRQFLFSKTKPHQILSI